MLENIAGRQDLLGLSRKKSQYTDSKSIKPDEFEQEQNEGWVLKKKNKKSWKVQRPKPHHRLLEDRVWTLLYKLGFEFLSGDGGAALEVKGGGSASVDSQMDVVAIDNEVALAVECKSFENPHKDTSFEEKIGKHELRRKHFAAAVRERFPTGPKRSIGMALFTSNILLTENDRTRAQANNVAVFEDQDLQYYEKLVAHLGVAARYQFLSDIMPMRLIPGLEVKVPALQTKMGKSVCYSFSIQPDYLLKIAYVAHRAKGKPSDVDAYQRMISKTRLKQIREYITNDGVFPTNIVLNIEKSRYMKFEEHEERGLPSGAKFGLLSLTPAYRSAWVIDGQHRLFAFSGHEMASKSHLNVLAFENLPADRQARFFIDINHEQKSVKRNLLDELWAELHWDSEDDQTRIRAVISKAVQILGTDRSSPFYQRILLSDAKKTESRCISLTSLLDALNKPGMYLRKARPTVPEHGPLFAGSNDLMLKRTVAVVEAWFSEVIRGAGAWWEIGSGPGGGLAMNDGVTVCTNVMRSVIEHLQTKQNLNELRDSELVSILAPYGKELGAFLGGLSSERRKEFRSLRGVGGQTTGTRMCQQGLRGKLSHFDPPGLQEWINEQSSGANEEALRILRRIELTLQERVVAALKKKHGEAEHLWYYKGVPSAVRKKVDDRINETDGEVPEKENNFDLIHYRAIILDDWPLFEQSFSYGKGSKDQRTNWIVICNKARIIATHPSKRKVVPEEQLRNLREIDAWLHNASKSPSTPPA